MNLPNKAWRFLFVLTMLAGTVTSSAYLSARNDQARFVAAEMPQMIGDAPASVPSETPQQVGSVTNGIEQASSTAAAHDIPITALNAYNHAAVVLGTASMACHLDWSLLAAIGEVESDHGRTAGNELTASGVSRPGIFGPVLNGNGVARIADTDDGSYDRDSSFDRAVGPMQFIPSTWKIVAVDADGDGKKDPQNINDAALGAGVYLCAASSDLSTAQGLRSSILRYNHDDSYADRVLALMRSYASGDNVFAASAGAFNDAGPYRSASFNRSAGAKHKAAKPLSPRPAKNPPAMTPAVPTSPPKAAKPAAPGAAVVTPLQNAVAVCQSKLTAGQIDALGGVSACATAYLNGGLAAVRGLLGGLTGSLSTLLGH